LTQHSLLPFVHGIPSGTSTEQHEDYNPAVSNTVLLFSISCKKNWIQERSCQLYLNYPAQLYYYHPITDTSIPILFSHPTGDVVEWDSSPERNYSHGFLYWQHCLERIHRCSLCSQSHRKGSTGRSEERLLFDTHVFLRHSKPSWW